MTITGASFLAARTRSAPQGFGRPVPRKEDARLVTGRGRFSDDFNLPGQAHAHLVRSPHAHARILSIEAAAALAVPGVLAVLTGRDAAADGLASIPHKPVPTNPNEFPLGGREGGRVLVTPHPPLAADVARFAGEAVAMVIAETAAGGGGRGRARAGRLRAAAVGHRHPRGGRARRARPLERARLEPVRGLGRGRRARRRRRLRVGRAHRPARHLGAAHHRRAHGAARGPRRLRRADRALHALRRLGRRGAAEGRSRGGAGRAGGGGARGGRGRGRQLRHAEQLLSRVRAGRVGGAAPRPAGEVDVRAPRGVPDRLPGARPRLRDGAGPRRGRPLPRAPGREHEQCRRAHRDLRAAQQGARAGHHRLPGARRRGARPRGAQQYLAALRLPQRGPAPGDVRDGAAHRPGRAPPRLRPGRAAAPQPGADRRHAVHQPVRDRLRQRRLRGGPGPRGGAGRLGRLRGAAPRGPRARALPRDRPRQLHRDRHRRAARAGAHHGAARGTHRRGDRHPRGRPGPRDELRPARRRVARLLLRPGAPDQRRHRSRRGGWRLTLGTLNASRRCSHGEGGGPDRGEGRAPRGVAARVGGGRSRVLGRALPGARHRSRHRPLRGRGRRRAPRRTGGPARAARWSVRRDREHAVLPVRLRGVRGRGGSGDRRGGGRPLHLGGRRGPRHQPADRGRADPRRDRPGPGPGPLGALPLRRGERPAPVGDLHGVRDAARRSACPRSPPRSARCRPPRTRSACAAAARAARPRRSGPR